MKGISLSFYLFSNQEREIPLIIWRLALFQVHDHRYNHWILYQLYKISWHTFALPSFQNSLRCLNCWMHSFFCFPTLVWIYSLLKTHCCYFIGFQLGKKVDVCLDNYLNPSLSLIFSVILKNSILFTPTCVEKRNFFV